MKMTCTISLQRYAFLGDYYIFVSVLCFFPWVPCGRDRVLERFPSPAAAAVFYALARRHSILVRAGLVALFMVVPFLILIMRVGEVPA